MIRQEFVLSKLTFQAQKISPVYFGNLTMTAIEMWNRTGLSLGAALVIAFWDKVLEQCNKKP